MSRDPRYDILFEPVKIGPVTAKNRFYQVPHCNGMGHRQPRTLAAMRGVKAAGGWAVVCTEEVEISPDGEVSPFAEGRLWDDSDIANHARVVEAIQEHGALAGIELVHNGHSATNLFSRIAPMSPSHTPIDSYHPVQARAMDKADIKALRQTYRAAALRSKKAGYDLVYVYAGHDLTMLMHFLSRRHNHRGDEYGGSLENRVRLFREVLEDTKEAVGDSCAVAVRFAVDELLGPEGITAAGEGREVVEMLAELPDLWDVNVSAWPNDSVTSRFGPEGSQEDYVAFVKQVTSKPVVGVGRFTSPDTMVSQIKRGVLDFIGAARPSIADPYLPKKIEEGRLEDIRECIGCNICVSGDYTMVPMRCTQNPTMGEEWRRGWNPETIAPKGSDDAVLVVGAGPAGLEAARALGQRGYRVTLAEAGEELGGRVARECRLPGLSAWSRVRDYRVQQLQKMVNVEIYPASRLTAENVREFGFPKVLLATGARWRQDGFGRAHRQAIPGSELPHVITPDTVIDGARPEGPVVIYDDDHYYLGGVLAEKLRDEGLAVTLVTPADNASQWSTHTMEMERIQTRLLERGVTLATQRDLMEIGAGQVEIACIYSDRRETLEAATVVMVTSRLPNDALYQELLADSAALAAAGIVQLQAIGDCHAPATIAAAVHAGHLAARDMDASGSAERAGRAPFLREDPGLV